MEKLVKMSGCEFIPREIEIFQSVDLMDLGEDLDEPIHVVFIQIKSYNVEGFQLDLNVK